MIYSSFSFTRFVNQIRLLEEFLGSTQQIRSSPPHPPTCIPTHLVPNPILHNLPWAADFTEPEGSTSCYKNSSTVLVLMKLNPIQIFTTCLSKICLHLTTNVGPTHISGSFWATEFLNWWRRFMFTTETNVNRRVYERRSLNHILHEFIQLAPSQSIYLWPILTLTLSHLLFQDRTSGFFGCGLSTEMLQAFLLFSAHDDTGQDGLAATL
jgi:hypothetical protein